MPSRDELDHSGNRQPDRNSVEAQREYARSVASDFKARMDAIANTKRFTPYAHENTDHSLGAGDHGEPTAGWRGEPQMAGSVTSSSVKIVIGRGTLAVVKRHPLQRSFLEYFHIA